MKVYVVKYADGRYFFQDDEYYNKGTFDEAIKFLTYQEAEKIIQQEQIHLQNFLKDPSHYVKGTTAETYACEIYEWEIQERKAQ